MLDRDRAALFRSWLTEHSAAVFKVARAYTINPEDGHDLAQEIFLQVWRSLPRFGGQAEPATWCYRVALNTALGWHRRERRRRGHQQSLVEVAEPPDPRVGDALAIEQRETVARLNAAIRRLPKTDAALVLLHLDGLSYHQIAEVLGITEGNVGVKLNRAKKALRLLLGEEPHDP